MEQYLRIFPWTEMVPVSAQTADNTDRLLSVTVSLLDEGEATYNEDMDHGSIHADSGGGAHPRKDSATDL